MPQVAANRYSQKPTAKAASRNERDGATKIFKPFQGQVLTVASGAASRETRF